MDKVSVKILFGGSLFFSLVCARKEAQNMLQQFRDGTLKGRIGDKEGNWVVKVESIHCMHIEEIGDGGPTNAWG
jgi:hypothetical protein